MGLIPPFWTMLKKTADLGDEGTPYNKTYMGNWIYEEDYFFTRLAFMDQNKLMCEFDYKVIEEDGLRMMCQTLQRLFFEKNARKSTRRCARFTCIDCIQCIDCIDCGDCRDCIDCGDCRMYGLQRLYTYMDMDCRDQQLKISHKTFCEIFPLRNLLCWSM